MIGTVIFFLSFLFVLQVHTAYAKYIVKCDDDTFVRVDAVLKEAKKVSDGKSLYVGNINYYHKPLRDGKWAVTYEVQFNHPISISSNLKCRKLLIHVILDI